VLYSLASSAKHFPSPKVVCDEPCAQVAERSLTVGPVKRLPWAQFLEGLNR
jgi:hypothetical protein